MIGAFAFALIFVFWGETAMAQNDAAPEFADYARIADMVLFMGVAIPDVVLPKATGCNIDPSVHDGDLSDYSFHPASLPPCLTFNRFKRVLGGAPTVTLKKTAYTLWAHDDDDKYAVSDADWLRFTMEIRDTGGPESSAGASVALPATEQNATQAAQVFAASFESEYQWFQRDLPPALSGEKRWNAAGWRGERLQKQVLISGVTGGRRLSIEATDFSTEWGDTIAAAVSFRYPQFVVGDIEARGCDGYLVRNEIAHLSDALQPQPSPDHPPGYPAIVWISIDIPYDADPGRYFGTISIRSDGKAPARLKVSLQVSTWKLPLPSKRKFHLDLWQFPVSVLDRYNDVNPQRTIEVWSDGHYRLVEPFYRYLAELGQRVVTAYIKDGSLAAPSMIEWIALENGKRWKYDYSVFDAHVRRMASWGIDGQISAFSPVGWNGDEIPFRDAASGERRVFKAPIGSRIYNALWNNFLTDFKAHLKERGWFEKTVLYMDEVPEDEMERAIGLIRFNDEDWKIGLAYGHAPNRRVIGSLYDVSGYYETEPKVETYEGQLTTFYTSCSNKRPNSFVAADANPADMTAIPWYALARGHHGYLRWAFDNWKTCHPLDLRDGRFTAGDFSIVYRSSNDASMTVVPSVRSELLRDGIEDFEKIQVLREAIARCNREDLRFTLQTAVDSFSNEALMAGQAPDLLVQARERLHEVSRSITPNRCR